MSTQSRDSSTKKETTGLPDSAPTSASTRVSRSSKDFKAGHGVPSQEDTSSEDDDDPIEKETFRQRRKNKEYNRKTGSDGKSKGPDAGSSQRLDRLALSTERDRSKESLPMTGVTPRRSMRARKSQSEGSRTILGVQRPILRCAETTPY